MIIERNGVLVPTGLPSYFGVDSDGGIVGVGIDSAILLRSNFSRLHYVRSVALGEILENVIPIASAGIAANFDVYSNIKGVIEQMLKESEDEDELGRTKPTAHSATVAKELMFRLTQANPALSVPTDLFADRNGSIRATWEVGPRTLEVVSPSTANDRPYIYFSDDREYKIAYDTSSQRLSRLFSWLNGRVVEFPR
jgi:hypothetical protein